MSLIPFTPKQLRNIKSVGLELEGGVCWHCADPILKKYEVDLHIERSDDFTATVDFTCAKHGSALIFTHAELKAWASKKNFPLLFKFVDELFSSGGFRQNHTCGNHMHIMFTDSTKWKVFNHETMWNKFKQLYVETFKTNNKFEGRLVNPWCKSGWNNEVTVRMKNKYFMINFRSMEEIGTLEFRILPWFKDSEEAQHSYLSMLGIIDSMAGARAH